VLAGEGNEVGVLVLFFAQVAGLDARHFWDFVRLLGFFVDFFEEWFVEIFLTDSLKVSFVKTKRDLCRR
jgi:hypothetical protein